MRLEVTLYAQGQFWIGHVDLLPKERLSDLLNDVFVESPERRRRFLQINDVTVTGTDDRVKKRLKTTYVNKAAILIVVPHDGDSARGIGGSGDPKHLPFVQKTPVFARLVLPGYEVSGYMHCSSGQTPWSLLEGQLWFVPLTNVKIMVPGSLSSWTDPFAALNREQIVSFDVETLDSSS